MHLETNSKILLTLFAAGLGGALVDKFSGNTQGALYQGAAAAIGGIALPLIQENTSQKPSAVAIALYGLLLGGVGYLGRLPWKVNLAAAAVLTGVQAYISLQQKTSSSDSSGKGERSDEPLNEIPLEEQGFGLQFPRKPVEEGEHGESSKPPGLPKRQQCTDDKGKGPEKPRESFGASSSAPRSDDKDAIRKKISDTPEYVPSYQDYSSPEPVPEFISLFTHVHQILPGLYLGDYRAFLSVDPQFIEKYQMVDNVEDIGDNNVALRENVIPRLDAKGCSELGIKCIVSVTQFKPASTVQKEDWSLFKPNLEGIERKQISVDDDDSTWDKLEPELDEIFAQINQARLEGKPVLIHCVKGACRSAAVVIAYLMKEYQVTYEQAHNFVISIRHQVDIKPSWLGSSGNQSGLLGYEAKLKTH